MTCTGNNSYSEVSISESYTQSLRRITRSRRNEISSFHVSKEIAEKRKQSWDDLFEKYANMSNEVLLNIRTLESNEEDVDQYLPKRRICMRKSLAQVQHWVDTGMLSYSTLAEQSDHTITGSSLSEHEVHSPFPENLTVSHKSNGKQTSAIGSSCSSVDTAAYILSNTNVNKRTGTTGIESAKTSRKKGYKIVSCNHSLSGWVTKDKSPEVLAQTVQFTSNDNNNESSIQVGNIELQSDSHREKSKSPPDEENIIGSKSNDFEEQSALNCLQQATVISECLNVEEQNGASQKESSVNLMMEKEKHNSSFSKDMMFCYDKPKMQRRKLFTNRTSPVDLVTPIHIDTRKFDKSRQSWHPALESPKLIKRKSWSFRKQNSSQYQRKKTSLLPATIEEDVCKEDAALLHENGEMENQMGKNESNTSTINVPNHLNLTPTSDRIKLTSVENSMEKHTNDSTTQTITSISDKDQKIVQTSQESRETDNIAESKERTIFLKNRQETSNQPISLATKDISDSTNAQVKSTEDKVCKNSCVNLNPVVIVQRLSKHDRKYYKDWKSGVNTNTIDSTSKLSKNSVLKKEESSLHRKKNFCVTGSSSSSNSYQSEISSLSMKINTARSVNSDQSTVVMHRLEKSRLGMSVESIDSANSDQSTILMYSCDNIMNHSDNCASVCSNSLQNTIKNLQFTNELYGLILNDGKLQVENKSNPIVIMERLKMIDKHEKCNNTEQNTVDRSENSEQSKQEVFSVPDKLSSVNSVLPQFTGDRTIAKNKINKEPKVILSKVLKINNSCYTAATENHIEQISSYERSNNDSESTEISRKSYSSKSSEEKMTITSDAEFVNKSSDICNSLRKSKPSPSEQLFDYNIFKSPSSNVNSIKKMKVKKRDVIEETNELMEDSVENFSKNSQYQFANDSSCITIGSQCNNLSSLTLQSCSNKSQLVGQETSSILSLLTVESSSDEENSFIKLIENFRSRKRPKRLKMTLNNNPTDEESIKVRNNEDDGENLTKNAHKMKKIKDKKGNKLQTLNKDITENDKDPSETIHVEKINVSFRTESSSSESGKSSPIYPKRKRISRILSNELTNDNEKGVAELNKSPSHDNEITLKTISSNAEINTGLHTLVTRKQSINKQNISSSEDMDGSEKLNTSLQNKHSYSLRTRDNARTPVSNRNALKLIFTSSDEESVDEFSMIFTKSRRSGKLTTIRKLPSSATAQNEKYIRESWEDRLTTTKHNTLTSSLDDSDDKSDDNKRAFSLKFGSNQNKVKNDKCSNYSIKLDNGKESAAKKLITFRTRQYGISDSDET